MQIYWPYSENWDGKDLPIITFDPEDGAKTNIGYRIISENDGKSRNAIHKQIKSSIEKLEFFEEKLNINAYRIGYVVNMQQDSKDILKFKSKTIMNEKILKSEDFELSWLDFINVNGMIVNCWHRYYTNKQMNDKLNILYDINTKPEEKIEITKQFILKFIEDSEKYIDELDI